VRWESSGRNAVRKTPCDGSGPLCEASSRWMDIASPCGRPELLSPASSGQWLRLLSWHHNSDLAGNPHAGARRNKRVAPIAPYYENRVERRKENRQIIPGMGFAEIGVLVDRIEGNSVKPEWPFGSNRR
jgi:hypothetical protein